MKTSSHKDKNYVLFILISVWGSFFVIPFSSAQTNGQIVVVSNPNESNYRKIQRCSEAESNYRQLKSELRQKCKTAGCEEAARECNEEGGDGSSSGGWGGLSTVLSGASSSLFGGGFMAPTAGAAGTQGFRCLPSSTRDEMKQQLKDLRREAVEGEKEARDYKRDVQNEAKELRKEMADLKKDFYQQVANSKKAALQVSADVEKAREEAKIKAAGIIEKLDENEKKKATLIGEQEVLQSQSQALYPETVGKCADEMTAQKDDVTKEFFALKEKAEAEIAAASDIRAQERIRQKFQRDLAQRENYFNSRLKSQYDRCLQTQTRVYQTAYKGFQNKMNSMSKEINTLNLQNDIYNKELAEIPNKLAKDIDNIKKGGEAEQQLALQQLQTADQQIRESVVDYQNRYQEAQASYMQAQQKLNMEQLKAQTNQSAFQLQTFGDAASVVAQYDEAREEICSVCKDDPPAYCGGSSSGRSYDGGSR
ncbi:MAG: hypothetical protein RJB66_2504 [Pseudomonadota bacterium]|jgi:hypothetical protein